MTSRMQIVVDVYLSDKHRETLDLLGIDHATPFMAKIDEALSEMIDVLAKVLPAEDLPRVSINNTGLVG